MRKDISITVRGQKMLGVLENGKAEKLVILLHGFTGNMHGPNNTFDKLSQLLQHNGYAVLRFNFRGTPPSEMEFRDMSIETETEDFREALRYAQSGGYEKIGVVGESLGGTIAATGYDASLGAVVFWYPAFDLTDDSMTTMLDEKSMSSLKEKGYIEIWDGFRAGPGIVEDVRNTIVYDKIKEIRCPVLFIHGDQDKDDPVRQSEKAFGLAKEPKELVVIKGVGHCFRLEDMKPHPSQDEAIEKTVEFLRKYF